MPAWLDRPLCATIIYWRFMFNICSCACYCSIMPLEEILYLMNKDGIHFYLYTVLSCIRIISGTGMTSLCVLRKWKCDWCIPCWILRNSDVYTFQRTRYWYRYTVCKVLAIIRCCKILKMHLYICEISISDFPYNNVCVWTRKIALLRLMWRTVMSHFIICFILNICIVGTLKISITFVI